MGYILPITQYEYINYQARDMKDERQIQHVGKSYKVILRAKQDKLNNEGYQDKIFKKQQKVNYNKIKMNNQIDLMNYARMTGKGGIINEEV